MSRDFEKELNLEQYTAVRDGDGYSLVLAGAGSGKTRTITYRVAYLLEQGVHPSQILLLTFTNKAAQEMLHRVQELLGSEQSGMYAGTFHSVANRFLRRFGDRIGYAHNFTILDQEDSKDLIKSSLKELGIDTKNKAFPNDGVLQTWFSFARNSSESLEDIIDLRGPQFSEKTADIVKVYHLYEAKKRSTQTMDFDDLLIRFLELLKSPDGSTLSETGKFLAQQFRYVLVDEFQDTNAIQSEIVDWISSVHKNLFVVGDDAQSIYSFRAANIQNILQFPKRYPGAKIFKLETNYRSAPQILDIANAVISMNQDQFRKELVSVMDDSQKPQVVYASDNRQEADFLARTIRKLLQSGIAPKEIAVLFRASFHTQALEMELARNNIDYEYRGGLRFFERAHIKDVIAFVKVLHNPKDQIAWQRLLHMLPGVGPAASEKIYALIQGLPSVIEGKEEWKQDILQSNIAQMLPARAGEGWKQFEKIFADIVQENISQPSRAVGLFLRCGYSDYLESEYEQDYQERLDDLEQLIVFAEGYQDIESFISEIVLQESFALGQAERETLKDKIVLSTIHQAKGLEWHSTFVIHLAEGSFPSHRSMGEGDLEEERRLFYVAVTRAKRNLYLTMPRMGRDFSSQRPSQFLSEIPDHLIQEVEIDFGFSSSSFSQKKGYDKSHSSFSYFEKSYQYDDSSRGEKEKKILPFKSSDEITYVAEDIPQYKKPGSSILPDIDDL